MTLGEFRRATLALSDDLEIVMRWNDDDCSHVAGILPPTVEHGCTESPALMIDADTGEE